MPLQDSPNTRGVMGSKASGEPSLLLSVSVLHALRAAVKAARKEVGVGATRADLQAQRGGRPPCCARARGSFSPAEYAYKQLQLKFLTCNQPPPSASPAELHGARQEDRTQISDETLKGPRAQLAGDLGADRGVLRKRSGQACNPPCRVCPGAHRCTAQPVPSG